MVTGAIFALLSPPKMPESPETEAQVLFNRQDLGHKLHRLALQILEHHRDRAPAFVGIHTRGVTLAERVRKILAAEQADLQIPLGAVDVSFYRDDLDHLITNPEVQSTDIPFAVEGVDVIIFDDVLFTGRTIRSAIEGVMSFGRPKSIELAVLIDRGNRELPIQPDYVGEKIETSRHDHIRVMFDEHDGEDCIRVKQGIDKTTHSPMEPRKDLLEIEDLSREEIEFVLKTAQPYKELFKRSVKKMPTLQGKAVLNLFYEPSTRTRSSFEVAAKRLSADVTNLAVSESSVVKGESILDTVDTLQAMRADYIIVRHKASGIPNLIAKHTGASVINAGDGFHAHPTQALLDAYTLRERYPGEELAGKKVLIVGDILHSRVARSTSRILNKLDVEVGVLGPGTLDARRAPARDEKVRQLRRGLRLAAGRDLPAARAIRAAGRAIFP